MREQKTTLRDDSNGYGGGDCVSTKNFSLPYVAIVRSDVKHCTIAREPRRRLHFAFGRVRPDHLSCRRVECANSLVIGSFDIKMSHSGSTDTTTTAMQMQRQRAQGSRSERGAARIRNVSGSQCALRVLKTSR